MAMGTNIEWCDATFNPWIGCTKVSEGCKHCYAEALMDHRYGKARWGPTGTRVRTSAHNWNEPVRWNRQAAKVGVRKRVFCASLADVFEDRKELQAWRRDLVILMENTPNLQWLLLTKRPENIMSMLGNCTSMTPESWLGAMADRVWLGTSVENQEQADKRIPLLMTVPAAVRFLSMEPLIGPVTSGIAGVQWVIVGGESGKGARPMAAEWAMSIRDNCTKDAIPFFFKQGSAANWTDYKTFATFGDLAVRQLPEPALAGDQRSA